MRVVEVIGLLKYDRVLCCVYGCVWVKHGIYDQVQIPSHLLTGGLLLLPSQSL